MVGRILKLWQYIITMNRETSTDVAIPNSALLCEHLMAQYGEGSNRDNVANEARFETTSLIGESYQLLLIQKGVGSAAIYKAYVHQTLDGRDQNIFTFQAARGVVEQQKTNGQPVGRPYEWPADLASNLLYGCFERRIY